jgi:DeoR/GlpR family transcriptional regulator of sugar metabolism
MTRQAERLMPAQRHRAILDYLAAKQFARSSTLSDLMAVSEATIRRDFLLLERHGEIERMHGGAILSQRMRTEPAFSSSETAHPLEKQWIGKVAAGLVESGDTVFVNFGTTTSQVIRHLLRRTDIADVSIVTNNLSALLEPDGSGFEIILVGGSFRRHSYSVVGRFATQAIRQIFANKAFIGVDGISPKYGSTTPVSAEAEISRLMIDHTQGKVVVVADHSKWGVVSNFEIAPLSLIDTLIMDKGLSKSALSVLDGEPPNVILVDAHAAANST